MQLELSAVGESHARFAITDSGHGIPEKVLEKMMQPFFTTKEQGKGTGLGLSISKGIAQMHGGDLRYDQGASHTSFIFEIALKHEANDASLPQQEKG